MSICSRNLSRSFLGISRVGVRTVSTSKTPSRNIFGVFTKSIFPSKDFSIVCKSSYSTEKIERQVDVLAVEENPVDTSDSLAELVNFQDLGLEQKLCDTLKREFDIVYATPAQDALLKNFFKGRDIILRDTTGSGKTFATTLALLSKALSVSDEKTPTQSLLLVPNRELAIQIETWCKRLLGPAFSYRLIQIIYKGKETDAAQEKLLSEVTPLLIVGTPNRIFEIVNTKPLIKLKSIKHVILDEVDHLLRLPSRYAPQKRVGLREKHPKPASLLMKSIFELTRPQVGIMSATLNRGVRFHFNQLNWMEHPVYINGTASIQSPPESLEHMCVVVTSKEVYNLPFEPKKEKLTPEEEQQVEETSKGLNKFRGRASTDEITR
ncbi:hypothetical protein DSO57_1006746 [Entomophthora muscae]|uniref:Uncharacterized protein n=1 Tax=Entomophthora muscae TaxID=34485 RepID=A0ACC2RML2_9FUNG|nr:hypothetical protein DSO57_1006746 [Entomophthora muscae]